MLSVTTCAIVFSANLLASAAFAQTQNTIPVATPAIITPPPAPPATANDAKHDVDEIGQRIINHKHHLERARKERREHSLRRDNRENPKQKPENRQDSQ